jgi:hypothetical protein
MDYKIVGLFRTGSSVKGAKHAVFKSAVEGRGMNKT